MADRDSLVDQITINSLFEGITDAIKDVKTFSTIKKNLVVNNLNSIKEIIRKITSENLTLKERNEDMVPANKTYASVTTTQLNNMEMMKTKNVIIISPKETTQVSNSVQVKNLLKQEIKPTQLNVGINKVKTLNNNRVLIECQNKQDCQSLANKISKLNTLDAVIPRKRNPRLILFNIDQEVADDDVVSTIVRQNSNVKLSLQDKDVNEHIKLIFTKTTRNNDKFAVLEVSPVIRNALISNGKLYIGYNRCTIRDHLYAIKCYNCLAFGHTAKDCKEEITCSKCGDHHDAKTCQNTSVKGANCMRTNDILKKRNAKLLNTNHSVNDIGCPNYNRIINIIKSKINYG